MKFVSVIIPVYNDLKGIKKLLPSLIKQTYPQDSYEIIVVDNNSTENISSALEEFNVILLNETDIQSSYAARNKGIENAKGDIFAFVDSDCVVCEKWLELGVNALEQNNIFLAGGKLTFVFSKGTASNYYDAITNMQIEEKIKRGTCATANLFVKKCVFDEIGLFPQYMKSGGDVFFTKKATQNNFNLIYVPEMEVFHPTRQFWELAKKTFRVGIGKAGIKKNSKNINQNDKIKLVQSGSVISLFNPMILKRKLMANNYKISSFMFLKLICAAYSILFIGFVGIIYGKLFNSK